MSLLLTIETGNTNAVLDLFRNTRRNRRQTEGINESLDHIRLTVDTISTFFKNEDKLDTQTQFFYYMILLFNNWNTRRLD